MFIDFATPLSNLTFNAIAANSTGGSFDVSILHGGQTTTLQIAGNGSSTVPTPVDLSAYVGITRLEIVNVIDAAGVGFDDFRFTR